MAQPLLRTIIEMYTNIQFDFFSKHMVYYYSHKYSQFNADHSVPQLSCLEGAGCPPLSLLDLVLFCTDCRHYDGGN